MFSFLCLFGPGAITLLIVEKCMQVKNTNFMRLLLEWVAYSALDVSLTVLLLEPLGRAGVYSKLNGESVLSYGSTAVAASVVIAVIGGILVSIIKKKIDIRVQIIPKEERINERKEDH